MELMLKIWQKHFLLYVFRSAEVPCDPARCLDDPVEMLPREQTLDKIHPGFVPPMCQPRLTFILQT